MYRGRKAKENAALELFDALAARTESAAEQLFGKTPSPAQYYQTTKHEPATGDGEPKLPFEVKAGNSQGNSASPASHSAFDTATGAPNSNGFHAGDFGPHSPFGVGVDQGLVSNEEPIGAPPPPRKAIKQGVFKVAFRRRKQKREEPKKNGGFTGADPASFLGMLQQTKQPTSNNASTDAISNNTVDAQDEVSDQAQIVESSAENVEISDFLNALAGGGQGTGQTPAGAAAEQNQQKVPYALVLKGQTTQHPLARLGPQELYVAKSGQTTAPPPAFAMSSFASLNPDEWGYMKLVLVPDRGEMANKLQQELAAIKAGQPLEETNVPLWLKIMRGLKDFIVNVMTGGQAAAEKEKAQVRPPKPSERPPQENAMISEGDVKITQPALFRATFYVGAGMRMGGELPPGREKVYQMMVSSATMQLQQGLLNPASGQSINFQPVECNIDGHMGIVPPEGADGSAGVAAQPTVLSAAEIAACWPIPDSSFVCHGVDVRLGQRIVLPRRMPPTIEDPLNPPPGVVPIGMIAPGTTQERVVGVPVSGLQMHTYICGTTGSGKSTLLSWMVYGLAKNNVWVPGEKERGSIFVVDPHGTLVDDILRFILSFAPERAKDVLLLDFGDAKYPIGFNPLNIQSRAEIEGTVSAVKEMLLKILNLDPNNAPRATLYAQQSIAALAEANAVALADHPDLHFTLLNVPDFLLNQSFRHLIMHFCSNEGIIATFGPDGKWDQLSEKQQIDQAQAVLRTFESLRVMESFQNVFGQPRSRIDFARWVTGRRIVLMKLPTIGPSASDIAKFIGALVTPMLLSSINQWGERGGEHSAFLVMDEFQNYASRSFERLLAETRKFGCWGIASNQMPAQIPQEVLVGLKANAHTKFSGKLDAENVGAIAKIIAGESNYPQPADIVSLPNYNFVANVKVSASLDSGPFTMMVLPPPFIEAYKRLSPEEREEANKRYQELLPQVIERSRLEVARPVQEVLRIRREHMARAKAILQRKVQEQLDQYSGPLVGDSMRTATEHALGAEGAMVYSDFEDLEAAAFDPEGVDIPEELLGE